MTEATLLPFDLPAVQRKKLTVDFEGGTQSSDAGLLLLREAERKLGVCQRLADAMPDHRDPACFPRPLRSSSSSKLTLIEATNAGSFERTRVNEYVLAALIRLNKTKS